VLALLLMWWILEKARFTLVFILLCSGCAALPSGPKLQGEVFRVYTGEAFQLRQQDGELMDIQLAGIAVPK